MNLIKIKTCQKHRFGRKVNISGCDVQIDAAGFAEIPEEKVAKALISGFELVDKDAKFVSEEELKKVSDVNQVLDAAKAQAAEIIAQATKQAAEIIAQAKAEAEGVKDENKTDDKAAKKAELEGMKAEELKNLYIEAGGQESEVKGLKKPELVDKVMSVIFEG